MRESLIRSTGLIGDGVILNVLVGRSVPTTVASIVVQIAIKKNLRRDVDLREGGVSHDRDSVRQSRGGSLGPARAAVEWNVLVLHLGEVVLSVNVTPREVVREVVDARTRHWVDPLER